jgi:hypothetical protein
MSQWNTLSVPLEGRGQCRLVLADQYRSLLGHTSRFRQDDGEIMARLDRGYLACPVRCHRCGNMVPTEPR